MKFITVLILIAAASVVGFGHSAKELKVIDAVKVMDREWIVEAYSSKDLADFDRVVASDFMITGANREIQIRIRADPTYAEIRSSHNPNYLTAWQLVPTSAARALNGVSGLDILVRGSGRRFR
ncbi:MAG: hypothetical protein WKF34_09595 [Pyrinomonadaceae bacterium]